MRWRREQADSEASEPSPDEASAADAPHEDAASEDDASQGTDGPPQDGDVAGTVVPGPPSVWADHETSSERRPDLPDIPVDLGNVDPDELQRAIRRAVSRALAEDLGDRGDLTTVATVPAERDGLAEFVARSGGVIAGLDVAIEVFRQVDPRVTFTTLTTNGHRVEPGAVIATVSGSLRSILTAERTALNFLGHLSGVATETRRYADALAGTGTVVRDTRKTTPGLRLLDKAAVHAGGGANHRVGLYDAILVKDNHVLAAGGAGEAAQAAIRTARGRHVQVEITSLEQIDEVLRAGVHDLLLDNFTPDEVRLAVRRIAGRARVEASGNITLETIRAYAEAGADRIACGALTHSAPWVDIALDVRAFAEEGGEQDWTLAALLEDEIRPEADDHEDLELSAAGDLPFIDAD